MALIRVKKSFTLIELIVVILLIFSLYFLLFSTSSFKTSEENQKITLLNLKEYLLKNYDFKENLKFFCIEEDFSCFIKVDDKLDEKFLLKNFFLQKPEVLKYSKEMEKIEYLDTTIQNETQKVIFELSFNSDYKSKDFILDTLDEKIYLFNSIYKKPLVFESIRALQDDIENKQIEVKDAF